MKKLVLFLLSFCMIFQLAACENQSAGNSDSDSSTDELTTGQESSADDGKMQAEEDIRQEDATGVSYFTPEVEYPYTSEDFPVIITGGSEVIERTLPFPVQDLVDAGWTLEGAEDNLCYGTYTWENRLTCGERELIVQIENNSDHDRPTSECQVVKLNADKNHPDTVTVADFAIGDSADRLTTLFDVPLIITDRDEGQTYVYSSDIYKRFDVSFDEESGTCVTFDLQWMES